MLLDAYPDAAKAKENVLCVAAGGACPLSLSLTCVCVAVCRMGNYARSRTTSEAVIKALLDAYPDAAKEKNGCVVAAGGACCALSLSPHVCVAVCRMGSCRSTAAQTTSQRR